MPRLTTLISSPLVFTLFTLSPVINSGINSYGKTEPTTRHIYETGTSLNNKLVWSETDAKSEFIYDSMQLEATGLNKEAFRYAYRGYKKLEEENILNKEGIITICDFSQSSSRKRLYVIDLNEYKILLNTYVAHGRNSGFEFAKKFSNKPQSRQSSLGFYKTKTTYMGSHGLALTLSGLEKGINDKAERRKIVVHGSDYVGENYLQPGKFMGRSFGCPAVPRKYCNQLIQTIKNGTCLFIYHPTKQYLSGSKILNG